MDDHALIQWLLENAGPAIRYRTATELTDSSPGTVDELMADLLDSPMVAQWLAQVGQPGGFTSFHGSDPGAFENVCAKLSELGLRAGIAPLDSRMRPYRDWLSEATSAPEEDPDRTEAEHVIHGAWVRMAASCLAFAGYRTDHAVGTVLSQRLGVLYEFARLGTYDIYIDQDAFGDFNNAFRKKQLVNPAWNNVLPGISDIYGLAHLSPDLTDAQSQVDTVVAYVLHPDYQALDDGYGAMRTGKRRYWSMGWSVHLPGYDGFAFDDARHPNSFPSYLVQRLELMAHFAVARGHRWFQDCLEHLEEFRTPQGTYRFPSSYLCERRQGYWVTGAYMRLEENRRRRQSLEADSTFRMLKIKRLMRDG